MIGLLTRRQRYKYIYSIPDLKTLWLGPHSRARHQLSFEYGIDDMRFHASYWYADVDFYLLEEKYGLDFMNRIYFHIAAFTGNTLVSLRPDMFDPGPYSQYCTSAFWDLWKAIIDGAWAQWRYENNQPDYSGPHPATILIDDADDVPVFIDPGESPILSFCGGGKDSLVSIKLLQGAAVPFDTLVYSSSVYGPAENQHRLCDSLLDAAGVEKSNRRRVWCFDDLTDSPVLNLPYYQNVTMTSAETPASVFIALPLALQHGYTHLCLGHERSADTGNLVWEKTGEEVNHQWGKSSEAEELLNSYIGKHLVMNCNYFSILKPVYDVLIFNLLAQNPEAAAYTHSCNIQKPWCGKCPKCAYVWINYMAYLPAPLVQTIFSGHGNLLDAPENQMSFRQMLGLESHTPFECIGHVNEARLAFELCSRKGIGGKAMQIFKHEVPPVNMPLMLERYLQVNDYNSLPDILKENVITQMKSVAKKARLNIERATAENL